MHIGIVSATQFEIDPSSQFLKGLPAGTAHRFSVLITGVGILPTTYHLSEALRRQPFDLLVQAGIGGGFSARFPLEQVVLVKDEVMGDLGVEEEGWNDVFDMGFAEASGFPFQQKRLVNPFVHRWESLSLPLAHGLTVNEISSRPERIAALQQKYSCDVESMEGAAFHYVCLQQNIPFLQLRAISNRVGERNKKNWKIREAIGSLNKHLIRIIEQINES